VYFFLCFLKLTAQDAALAQSMERLEYDTSYIQTLDEKLHFRLYLSRKFTNLELEDLANQQLLDYEPNTTLNAGFGATYKGFTLNLAYGFAFLNQEQERGETSYLDLQSHFYGRKYIIDLFGQFYQGMYLSNTQNLFNTYPTQFYLRPDLRITMLGGSYFRLLNHEKFSYAASFVQNERQKKSAGSLLLGGKFVVLSAQTDSSLIPFWQADSTFNSFQEVRQMSGFLLGPGATYAHTFIAWENWFFTLSFQFNLMLSSVNFLDENDLTTSYWQVNPSTDVRIAAGYNSELTYVGFNLIVDGNVIQRQNNELLALFGVGNVRFNYVKRLKLNKKWRKRLSKLTFN
jgi:hypothetical protein